MSEVEKRISAITNPELKHLVNKCYDARRANSYGVLSSGEKVAAAIVLNRPQWLDEMQYTLAEAFDRVGEEWWPLLLEAQRILDEDQ